MNFIKITDLTNQLDISSRSLRYYEQVGLIQSIRPDFEKYRYYDAENIERLKQIMVLRKMQIPIKDIIRIFESEDMSVVVEAFVNRINAIDDEINALSELKRIVNDFLQIMIKNGIKKISALPLLYEEIDKQLEVKKNNTPVNLERLSDISETLQEAPKIRIVELPIMRMITSYKSNNSNIEEFWDWIHTGDIIPGNPGAHEQFEYQDTDNQSVVMLKIPDNYHIDSCFREKMFEGGLFAVASVYADEDLEVFHRALIQSFDGNLFYEIDYTHGGKQRHETLIETLLSPDNTRELLDIYIPVKRRFPNALHFDKSLSPEKLENITEEEIEQANPILWKCDVQLDKLVPIYKKGYEEFHYEIFPDGEVEFTPYVSTRFLSTDIKVRLPFRVDCEFKTDNHFLRMYHDGIEYIVNGGYHTDPRLARGALEFMQPIYRNWQRIDEAGRISLDEYNRVSWIIGEKYLTVIINDEVRYCGTNFPYMRGNFGLFGEHPIIFGSNGNTIYLRSVTISQLKYTPRIRVKKENFNMITKQSNNILPNIRVICRGDRGENHQFCGIAAYVMECIGEKALGEFNDDKNESLWFFEGLTADVLTQVYSNAGFQGWARSEYLFSKDFVRDIFDKCGYASTFISPDEFNSNKEMYLQTVMAYIDKGVPVLMRRSPHSGCKAVCGYEDYGKALLYLDGSNTKEIEKYFTDGDIDSAFIFVGGKKRDINVAELYKNMIYDLPEIFEQRSDKYCFGANAFAAWAEEIENNTFMPDTVYVCDLATNSGCSNNVFEKVIELNPDMAWVVKVKECYNKTSELWNEIEKIGMGFGITQDNLKDAVKRDKFAELVRKAEKLMRDVINIINANKKAG